LQHAIYTSTIVNHKELKQTFDELPKKWKKAILKMLDKAKYELLLLDKEIDLLTSTLQNDDNPQM